MNLYDVIGFADLNKIDYHTDIEDIIEACKVTMAVKSKTKKKAETGIDVKAEKAKLEIEKDRLYKWYNSFINPSITVGANAAKIFYEHIECFKEDNSVIVTPNIVYIGSCEFIDTDGRQKGAKVFVDTSDSKDKREVFFNFHEQALSNILMEYPGIVIDRELMR